MTPAIPRRAGRAAATVLSGPTTIGRSHGLALRPTSPQRTHASAVTILIFNILNSHSDQITYTYRSLLKSDSLFAMCFPSAGIPTAPAAVCQTGVVDRVLHPVEPLAIRLTVAGQF